MENGGRGLVIGEGARVSYLVFSGEPGLSVQQEGGARFGVGIPSPLGQGVGGG